MVDTPKVTLCVLFNHPYLKNIPILEEIYAGKFDRIYFVVPNTRVPRKDVITSYRGSYIFHGMVADAAPRLLADDSTHFVFAQDDVLLNPRFSGADLVSRLRLEPGGAFLPKPAPIGGDIADWPWLLGFVWKTRNPMNPVSGCGVEDWRALLPDVVESFDTMREKYGFEFPRLLNNKPPLYYGTASDHESSETLNRALINAVFASTRGKGVKPIFPYCSGVADFFAVNRATLEKLAHLLGVFAALDVFVEIALPTALLLAAERVTFETDADCELRWYWNGDRSGIDFEKISSGFERNLIAVHPVKLSKDLELVRRILDHLRGRVPVPA